VHESVALQVFFISLHLLAHSAAAIIMSSEFPIENFLGGRVLPKACMSNHHDPGRLHLLDMDGVKSTASVAPTGAMRDAVRLVQLMRLAHDSLSLTGRNRVLGHDSWLHQSPLIFEIAIMIGHPIKMLA
jgi:hypothetical protein